jgi:hypothetical protein
MANLKLKDEEEVKVYCSTFWEFYCWYPKNKASVERALEACLHNIKYWRKLVKENRTWDFGRSSPEYDPPLDVYKIPVSTFKDIGYAILGQAASGHLKP